MDKLDLLLENQIVIMEALKTYMAYETGKLIDRNKNEHSNLLKENIGLNLSLIKRLSDQQNQTKESLNN